MKLDPRRQPAGFFGLWLLAAAAISLIVATRAYAQELRDIDRARGQTMLKVIKKDLQKYYYDPTFRGLDLEESFLKAEQDIDQATSLGQVLGIIARAVLTLDDSHTRFVPPSRTAKFNYGWRVRVIGETPTVIAVKPGSDAEAKGLKAGDAVLSVDGSPLNRKNMPLFRYRYLLVRPAPGVGLVVQSPGGQPRRLDVATKVDMGKRVVDLTQGEDIWDIMRRQENQDEKHRYIESPDKKVFLWNIPSFSGDVSVLKRIAGRLSGYDAAVLDLRGNPGGVASSVCSLLGYFFDHDVTVAQPKGREPMKPMVAKTQGSKAFSGKLIVVVDSESGSGAEIVARIIQIEKRGTVVGDRTAGAVMGSRYHPRELGGENIIPYGISVTEMEILMKDGGSLEGVGVTPDILALPTGADLAAQRDPVLTLAVGLAGAPITPEEAGKLFPYKWLD